MPRRKLPHHTLPRLLAVPHRTALTAAAASAASAASASSAAVSHSPPALPRHTPALPPPPPQAPLVRHRRQQSSARWMAARRMHDSAALASVAPRIAPPLPRPRINFVLQFNVFSALAALGSCICQHRRAVADPQWDWRPHVGSWGKPLLTVACSPRACAIASGERREGSRWLLCARAWSVCVWLVSGVRFSLCVHA